MIREGEWVKMSRTSYFVKATVSNGFAGLGGLPSGWEVWTPKSNEWCWFYNEGQNPDLRMFCHIGTVPGECYATSGGCLYDFVEPFRGELPDGLNPFAKKRGVFCVIAEMFSKKKRRR